MMLQGQQNWGSTAPPNNFVGGGACPPMTELVLRVLLHRKHARVISSLHSSTALVMRLTSIPETKKALSLKVQHETVTFLFHFSTIPIRGGLRILWS